MEDIIMPEEIHGLTKVDYLTGFVSLLYAFSVSEFFMGWSKMLRNRQELKFDLDHIIFSIIFFWLLILNWYGLWPRVAYLNDGFIYLILTIIPILVVYFASVIIFPDLEKVKDLRAYNEDAFNKMLFCCALYVSVNIFIGLGIGEYHLISKTVLIRLFNCVLLTIVAFFNLKKFRRLLMLWMAVGLAIGSVEYAFK